MGLTAIGVAAAGMGMGCIPNGKKRIPKTHPQSALAEPNNIRSVLLHLGNNMWCDYPSLAMGKTPEEGTAFLENKPDLTLRCSDKAWREATDRAAEKGARCVIGAKTAVDAIGEGWKVEEL